MNIQLPKEWKWEKLDDSLEFVIGGDWGKDENFEDLDYDLAYCIRGSEIKNWDEEKGRTASLRKIKISNIAKRKLAEGDILVEISGGGPEQPVGRTVLIDKTVLSYKPEIPKICTNFLRLIRPKNYVEGKFLNFYLKLFYYSGEIVKYQGGSNNLRNLKFPDFIKINFPLPPKPIQQAIVSKIEELFSELDKGIENLRTAQWQLKTYRQSVLKWAFKGRLTNENVNEGELPKEWNLIKLGEIAAKIFDGPFGSNLKSVDYIDEGIRVIRLENIGVLTFKDEYKTFVSNEKYLSIQKHTVGSGDIIFSSFIIGEIRVTILPKFISKAINKADCFCIRVSPKTIDNRYLAYFLSTKNVYNQLVEEVHGATRPRINTTQLKSCLIPYCSIKEQSKIVQEIENRLSVADKMEESITQSLQQAEALRQSILKRAFEGKLIN